jgi:tetratricopeptide (TPR) repeat protein
MVPTIVVSIVLSMNSAAQDRGSAVGHPSDEGWAALKEGRYGDALDAFTRAVKLDSRNPHPHYGAGVAAFMLGHTREAGAWLERTLALKPGYTDATLLLGEMLHRGGKTREAIKVVEAGLKYAPEHDQLTQKLAEWRTESQLHDRFYRAQGAHFVVMFEGPVDESLARRAVDMLEAAYWRIGGVLSTYPSEPITVVLYTLQQFRDVTQAPDWSSGVYDGRIRVPMRGALERPADLERLLVHEYVHALVASIAGYNVPVWLNEGLAKTMEPGGRESAEAYLSRRAERLPHASLHHSFRRLPSEAVGLAYAQSAIAVQRMLDLRGAPALVTLLQALGRGAAFESAFQQSVYMRYEDFQAALR